MVSGSLRPRASKISLGLNGTFSFDRKIRKIAEVSGVELEM
jgi:hypothetical protein